MVSSAPPRAASPSPSTGSAASTSAGAASPRDPAKAIGWYQQAAAQGNVNAMYNLAVLLSQSAGGAEDQAKALQWFRAAADYGVRDSQYNLGVIYARGLGTPQDLVEAYKWFATAAAQGDGDAATRRDQLGQALTSDEIARAEAAARAWHAMVPVAEANSVMRARPTAGTSPATPSRRPIVRRW